jgi:transcriptional regulator with XRE-family HTH domain
MTTEQALAQRIRELRRRHFGPRGKAEFARRLGISPQEYERYERGTVPPGEVLVRMCELTGEDLQWLLVGVSGRAAMVITGTRARHQQLLARLAQLLDEKPELAGPVEAFVDLLVRGAHLQARQRRELPGPAGEQLVPIFEPQELPLDRPPGAARGFNGDLALAQRDKLDESAPRQRALLAEPASIYDESTFHSVELVYVERTGGAGRQYLVARQIASCFPGLFGVRLSDDTMNPMFRTGDIALVSACNPARPGRPALCRMSGEPPACCRIWLGQNQSEIQLGRLCDGKIERVPLVQLRWSLEVLYRLTAA